MMYEIRKNNGASLYSHTDKNGQTWYFNPKSNTPRVKELHKKLATKLTRYHFNRFIDDKENWEYIEDSQGVGEVERINDTDTVPLSDPNGWYYLNKETVSNALDEEQYYAYFRGELDLVYDPDLQKFKAYSEDTGAHITVVEKTDDFTRGG